MFHLKIDGPIYDDLNRLFSFESPRIQPILFPNRLLVLELVRLKLQNSIGSSSFEEDALQMEWPDNSISQISTESNGLISSMIGRILKQCNQLKVISIDTNGCEYFDSPTIIWEIPLSIEWIHIRGGWMSLAQSHLKIDLSRCLKITGLKLSHVDSFQIIWPSLPMSVPIEALCFNGSDWSRTIRNLAKMLIQNEIPKEIDDDEKLHEWVDRSDFWAIDIGNFSITDILNFSIDPDHISLIRFLANGGVKWMYDKDSNRFVNLKDKFWRNHFTCTQVLKDLNFQEIQRETSKSIVQLSPTIITAIIDTISKENETNLSN